MVAFYLKWTAVAVAIAIGSLIGAFAVGVLWPSPSLVPERSSQPLALVDVTMVDLQQSRLLPRRTVVIEAGRIALIGESGSVPLPPAAQLIDGTGRYLLPALWNMHTHVLALSPLLDLPLYIAYGVTNVRDMQGCPQPGDPFIACPDDKRRWTTEAVAGERVGPRIVASTSFMANGPRMLERMKHVPHFYGTATPEEAREFVRHFTGQVEAIKVYDNLPREAYFALAAEARRLGLEVVGHKPRSVSAVEAAAQQKSIEHARFILHESFGGSGALRAQSGTAWREDRRRMLDEHDPKMAAEIFNAMKREGTWYVPTHLTRWVDAYADDPAVRDDPLLRYLHPLLRWQWLEDVDGTLAKDPSPQGRETYREFHRKGLELTGAAHRAGVKILAGTDYIAGGPDVHRELEQLVLAGLSPAEALHAATKGPAEYFGLESEYGSVEEGKVADLLLLEANPLDDIRNTQRISAVIFNGNLYDRKSLDRISAHVQRQASSWQVGCKILWRFVKNPVFY
jgi:imidazolonepropionase-like amidohydrolase